MHFAFPFIVAQCAVWATSAGHLGNLMNGISDFDIKGYFEDEIRELDYQQFLGELQSIYSILKEGEESLSRRSYEPSPRRLPDLFTEEASARSDKGQSWNKFLV
ncbi:Oidioi.mRNA.OKI2018_I69.XSR.g15613.t1.cds [Oikopleura dioica]|uniref:Oidioi.mRNA.OKI2018_I69.XSR.g15613.t1.cds n=1 Tax=Oikopleura dioica TaxID=34765 RepID=A0ABN7SHE7_OIKDI|nr:Oidioi.mRNA.OKI2018_I69.XSR.g15613.t1.cds [Oikopleura dioica]